MKPHQQAVIFDWNGTLLNDTQLASDATSVTLQAFDLPAISIEDYRNAYHIPLDKLYIRLGCSEEILTKHKEKLYTLWGDHYDAHVHHTSLREGAMDVISNLKDKGHRCVILSNHTVSVISNQLERLGIASYFDGVLANTPEEWRDIMRNRNKGARLKNYIDKYHIQHAIVVGDSPEESEIAYDYGYVGVGLTGGYCRTDFIATGRPHYMIDSLKELSPIIEHVFDEKEAS